MEMVASGLSLSQRQQIAQRFDAGVDRAFRKLAPSKEWVRRALRRGGAPRCPIRIKRFSLDLILRYGQRLADLFEEFPDDTLFVQAHDPFLGYQAPGKAGRVDPIQALSEDSNWTDEWGTRWGHAAGGVGATPLAHPLENWSQLEGYLAGQLPDPLAPGRLAGAQPALDAHGASKYTVAMVNLALFERQHCLRGMERTFEDFYESPREVERLLEKLTEYYLGLIRHWGTLGCVDAIFMTDDLGSQSGLMISRQMWKRFFSAGYKRICAQAHAQNLDVIFHSCGNVTALIGDLIDIGIDVLDPVQPEAMNSAQVGREFGGKVAFSAGISAQWLASFSPAEVKRHVQHIVATLGRPFGNALLLGPGNMLTPEIPFENLRALFEAAHQQ